MLPCGSARKREAKPLRALLKVENSLAASVVFALMLGTNSRLKHETKERGATVAGAMAVGVALGRQTRDT